MSVSIDLELLIQERADYTEGLYQDLPIAVHVHKRLEQFRYLSNLGDDAIPIACLRNPSVSSRRNLLMVNKASSVPANSPLLFAGDTKHDRIVGVSYSSSYSDILATNETFVNSKGKERPLFYRHALPTGVKEASVSLRRNGNKELAGEGFRVDLEKQSVFTNQRNTYDVATGSYRLGFVSGSLENGTTFNTLLNPLPVVKEATWEDIDLTTGTLVDTYPLFNKQGTGSGTTFYFNTGGEWFIRASDKNLIQPRLPKNNRPDSPWFIRFTNGDVSGVVNGSKRRYSIPEFSAQPFIPYSPLLYGSKEDVLFVNKRVLQVNRKNLAVNPSQGLHLQIDIQDAEGNILYVYSTDKSRATERIPTTGEFVLTDRIASWDNTDGFIHLANEVQPGWVYYAKTYYEADDYTYTSVNLNPITNKRLQDHVFVFYCIPGVGVEDKALHHLVVDYDGVIVEASQKLGLTYPNLQLKHSNGSLNEQTVVGMKYFSEEQDSFLSLYAAGYSNQHAYLILAEVCGVDSSRVHNQLAVDIRRPGAVIKEQYYEEAVQSNPRILQSRLGYGELGQVVPEVNVMVLEPSVLLLEEYGGLLTKDQAETLLRKHMNSSGYALINWVYPKVVLTAQSLLSGQVELSMTWEGDFTYRLYRRPTSSDAWEEIYSVTNPSEGVVSYTDTGLASGQSYQYAASLLQNSIEFPKTESLSIQAR